MLMRGTVPLVPVAFNALIAPTFGIAFRSYFGSDSCVPIFLEFIKLKRTFKVHKSTSCCYFV